MQVGVNLLCLTGFVEAEHLGWIGRIADLGYDGVEIPVLRRGPEHYAWMGRELDAIGLRRTTTSVIPSVLANPLSDDPEIRQAGRAHLDWALDCAIALGAESIGGPMHAPIGYFTGAGPTEIELQYGVDAHRALAARASANGLYVSLEHLNRFETYFLNTMQQARLYTDRVDHPAFRIMYDTFHANIEEQDQARAIATLGDAMGVLHVSENDRGIPGRGHIDFAAVFGAARRTGYDGWVTLEAFGAGLPELAAATRVWRPLFPDFETLFAESIGFIRQTWAKAGP
ncbi:sugar phosphate isomerase/epimerase family protein [Devosia psychrophila]|uniref:D-psicose/D-tagatose/L-ribulose 3-epimerase n=1 Tax=Devosia psychrophila TaxID=728005 RepID=A0A0F5PZE9_9HYPH|nr:sugar phosphate isomerase/epimerase family protein [Devosia psychrophila]KKC33990.1 isomerase [Devosia psychrophila]SFD40426.1 D-psicose/D-tagatose/L-ribulose 3-epimerase [Devosia psychrophila]